MKTSDTVLTFEFCFFIPPWLSYDNRNISPVSRSALKWSIVTSLRKASNKLVVCNQPDVASFWEADAKQGCFDTTEATDCVNDDHKTTFITSNWRRNWNSGENHGVPGAPHFQKMSARDQWPQCQLASGVDDAAGSTCLAEPVLHSWS